MEKIGILASGIGSNAVNVLKHFTDSKKAQVSGVFCNKMRAYVLQQFISLGSDAYYFATDDNLLDLLEKNKVTFVVLAGYNKLIPPNVINAYKGKIVNLHPSHLPKHGGKGMYGLKVHEAVLEAKEKETGITIHHVTEKYDDGEIIFQEKIKISKDDTPESLQASVRELEHAHYPEVIEKIINGQL